MRKIIGVLFINCILLLAVSCGIEDTQPTSSLAAPSGLVVTLDSNNNVILTFHTVNFESYFDGFNIYVSESPFSGASNQLPGGKMPGGGLAGNTNLPTIYGLSPFTSETITNYTIPKNVNVLFYYTNVPYGLSNNVSYYFGITAVSSSLKIESFMVTNLGGIYYP